MTPDRHRNDIDPSYLQILAGLSISTLAIVFATALLFAWARYRPRPRVPEQPDVTRYEVAGHSRSDKFGQTVAMIGDLDGDGVPDLAVGGPFADVVFRDDGMVVAVSGRTGQALWRSSGPGADWRLGAAVGPGGDFDRDGVPDVLVGLLGHGHAGGPGAGVLMLSGRTGAVLETWPGPEPDDHYGHIVTLVGDVDGDGRPDAAVSAPHAFNRTGAGFVDVLSGRDGRRLHRLRGRDQRGDRFGFAVCALSDVDGDQRPDIAVGAVGDRGHAGAVYIFSGATGQRILRIDGDGPGHELGHDLIEVDDVDADGRPDLLVGAFAQKVRSYARIYALPEGRVVHQFDGAAAGDGFGHSVAAVTDVTGDGITDIAVGAPDATVLGVGNVGYVRIYDGRRYDLIDEITGHTLAEHFGYVVRDLGDIDGDGRGELAVGTTFFYAPGIARVVSPARQPSLAETER